MADSIDGLIVAAPASGSGKTVVTLGLLRSLARSGVRVASAKVGPDYIDPAFHAAASGRPCRNLDTWAMRPETLSAGLAGLSADAEVVVAEGVMGLFDGARGVAGGADGSTASLARATGWPVVLVVDAAAQAASAAAVVKGFADFDAAVPVTGVLFNRVGGPGHAAILTEAMAAALPGVPLLGCLPRADGLALPSRHLGLVQALEHADLPAFLDRAADWVAGHANLDALRRLFAPGGTGAAAAGPALPVLGGRIAVARDAAFAFAYPHVLDGWRAAGAALEFFSPLADEGPAEAADAVYLPGGYPELHAGRLAGNDGFRAAMAAAAARGAAVFGECGGYMVLGRTLTDADGRAHPMLGLLPVETSFAERRLHLGYRDLATAADGVLGPAGTAFRGHEFHYARIVAEGGAGSLFRARDAAGADLGAMGLQDGRVAGAFLHLIDRCEA